MSVNRLKGKFVEKGVTEKKISELIGKSATTLRKRFRTNGLDGFSAREIRIIRDALGMTNEEIVDIFLP